MQSGIGSFIYNLVGSSKWEGPPLSVRLPKIDEFLPDVLPVRLFFRQHLIKGIDFYIGRLSGRDLYGRIGHWQVLAFSIKS